MRRSLFRVLLLTLGLLLPGPAPAQEAGELSGVVRDTDRGAALWGALITIEPGQRSAVTDSQGGFKFAGLSRGHYRLTVTLSGYETLTQTVVCPDAKLDLWLLPSESTLEHEEVVIADKRDNRQASGRAEVSTTLVPQEVVLESAGAMEDPVRVVSSLPGVVPMSEVTPLFFVRGGAPQESFFYLDDALIFNPFQAGGSGTIFNAELIDDMKFYAGGHGVEYPGSLSGVLDIRYRDPAEDALHGSADLSLISTNALLEGPTFRGGPSFLVSFRRSNFEVPLAIVQALGLVSSTFVAPAFIDVYARIRQKISRGHEITISGLVVDDGLDLIKFKPEDVGGFGAGSIFYKNRTYVGIAHYRGEVTENLVHTAMASLVANDLNGAATGDNPLAVNSKVTSFTARSDWLAKFGGEDTLAFGLFANRTDVTILANSPDVRQFVGGIRFGGHRNVKNLDLDLGYPFLMAGLYLKTSWGFLDDRLVLEPGLRVSYETPAQEWLLEPRASLRIQVLKNLDLRLSAGLYQEPVLNPLQVSAGFGTPGLTAERAIHYIGALEWTPSKHWVIKAEAFYKSYDHMAANTDDVQGYLSGRVEPFTNEGSGGAYGADLYIEKKGEIWSGWFSYGYLNTWRNNPRLTHQYANASTLNPGQDIPHTLALVLFYKPAKGWKFSLRALAHSGNPYTPLDTQQPFDLELDANNNTPRWQSNPDYRQLNGQQAPFYFTLDLRGSYTWTFTRWNLELYLEVMNAQVRENVVFFGASLGRPPEEEPKFGPVFEMPIIPYFGLRGTF